MWIGRCSKFARAGIGLALVAGSVCGAPMVRAAAEGFSRPDAEGIRAATRQILSDTRFAPRKTFWQWLMEKLSGWEWPHLGLPDWLGAMLGWVLILWCVLTLLAILGHFIWTMFVLWGGRRAGGTGRGHMGGTGLHEASVEELLARTTRLAEARAFREALGVLMLAMLRVLHEAGVLRFHESKTNGEYLREYPAARPERDEFRRFVWAGEAAVYGGGSCGPETYQRLHRDFERIRGSVQQRS